MNRYDLDILLIEDNPADAQLVREGIADAGLIGVALTHCETLAAALEVAGSARFDVVYLDLGLPDSEGLESIAALKRVAPSLPIIVLTGNDNQELASDAMRLGAEDFVAKGDLSGDALARRALYALERQHAVDRRSELLEDFAKALHRPIGDLDAAIGGIATTDLTQFEVEQTQIIARLRAASGNMSALHAAMLDVVRDMAAPACADLGNASAEELLAAIQRRAAARSTSSSSAVGQTMPAEVGGDEGPAQRPMRRILLAEDNPGDARLVEEEFAEVGDARMELLVTTSLTDALDLISSSPFSAVLLDLGLPDASGLEAVAEIRRVAPRLPVVVLTGMDDSATASRTLSSGAQDYLVKGAAQGSVIVRSVEFAIERQRALNLFRDLVTTVAHELCTPLHNIVGYTHLLREIVPGPLSAAQTDALDAVLVQADAVEELLLGILGIAGADNAGDRETSGGNRARVSLFAGLEHRLASRTHSGSGHSDEGKLARRQARASRHPLPKSQPGLFARCVMRLTPRTKKILLVDRDADSRAIARAVLEGENLEVVEAASGSDGLERFIEESIALAVVASSAATIANGKGVRSLEEAAATCGVPALIVGDLMVELPSGFQRGVAAKAHLAKPFTPEQLRFAVSRALHG